jgi:hypothetical protein
MNTKAFFSLMIFFLIFFHCTYAQVLDTLICNKKGKICFINEKGNQEIYTGYLSAKINYKHVYCVKGVTYSFLRPIEDILLSIDSDKRYTKEYMERFRKSYVLFCIKGRVKDGYPEGEWFFYDRDMRLLVIMHFEKGLLNGQYSSFYPTGELLSVVNYTDGKKDGTEYNYDRDGSIGCYYIYEKGRLIKSEILNKKVWWSGATEDYESLYKKDE